MKIKFFVEIEGKLLPLNLDELLFVAATSGSRNGDPYSGFTSYEFTPDGVVFKHLPSWQESLLVKWNGERVTLPPEESPKS